MRKSSLGSGGGLVLSCLRNTRVRFAWDSWQSCSFAPTTKAKGDRFIASAPRCAEVVQAEREQASTHHGAVQSLLRLPRPLDYLNRAGLDARGEGPTGDPIAPPALWPEGVNLARLPSIGEGTAASQAFQQRWMEAARR